MACSWAPWAPLSFWWLGPPGPTRGPWLVLTLVVVLVVVWVVVVVVAAAAAAAAAEDIQPTTNRPPKPTEMKQNSRKYVTNPSTGPSGSDDH